MESGSRSGSAAASGAEFAAKTPLGAVFSPAYRRFSLTVLFFGSRDELLYGIGIGSISLKNFEEVIKKSSGTRMSWIRRMLRMDDKSEKKENSGETIIIGSTEPGAPVFHIATCCNPIPGDPVVGFKAPDGTITIHKKSCKVAETIAATHGDWVVVPKWLEQAEDNSFLVRISLKGIDRVGMLNDITRYLSLVMGANMRRLNLQAESGLFDGYIDLYVNSRDILDKMIKKLSSIEGIENVTRSEL